MMLLIMSSSHCGLLRNSSASVYSTRTPRAARLTSSRLDRPLLLVVALTVLALRQRPEVLQAQFTLRSARYGVNAARTTNTPVVSGSATQIGWGIECATV